MKTELLKFRFKYELTQLFRWSASKDQLHCGIMRIAQRLKPRKTKHGFKNAVNRVTYAVVFNLNNAPSSPKDLMTEIEGHFKTRELKDGSYCLIKRKNHRR